MTPQPPPPVHRLTYAAARKHIAGVTLVELMIALAIGTFLIAGAVTVFERGRATFRVIESVARLEESTRFVLDALEPDVRMAHHFGLSTRGDRIDGRAGPADPSAFAVTGDCGHNWAVHLAVPVEGSNNAYPWSCPARGDAMPGADTLTLRRAAERPEPPAERRLSVRSARFGDGKLFLGETSPGDDAADTAETHRLIVSGYYVSTTSTLSEPGKSIPSLRVKTLVDGPRIEDQEVLPGVEDLQVQLGIDLDAAGTLGRGVIDRYVNPDDPLLDREMYPDVRVLAVRLWLRLRTDVPEIGYTNRSEYRYADRHDPPPNDGFRRIVVSKTIGLRNARPAQ